MQVYLPALADYEEPPDGLMGLAATGRALPGFTIARTQWAYEESLQYSTRGTDVLQTSNLILSFQIYVQRDPFEVPQHPQ